MQPGHLSVKIRGFPSHGSHQGWLNCSICNHYLQNTY